jgi:hypothetical protein
VPSARLRLGRPAIARGSLVNNPSLNGQTSLEFPSRSPRERTVGKDLDASIGDAPTAAVWTYQSAPIAAHHRPYFSPGQEEAHP